MFKPCWRAAFILSVFVGAIANAQYAHFVAHSDSGDPVGQGLDYDLIFTPDNTFPGQFQAVGTETLDGAPSFLQFDFLSKDFSKQIGLSFTSDGLEAPLAIGTYNDATFVSPIIADHPGMTITVNYHQPTTDTGSFTITDFEYHFDSSTGLWQIDKFGVNFVQFSDGSNAPLTGTFTFDAHGSAVPEPASMSALGLGALLLARRRRKR